MPVARLHDGQLLLPGERGGELYWVILLEQRLVRVKVGVRRRVRVRVRVSG